jgi:hypothetical protein
VTATLDERTVAVTDQDVSRFYQAAQEHTDRPGDRDGRTRAGLAAVLGARVAGPCSAHGDLYKARSRDERNRMVRAGWDPVGFGVDVDGHPVYVLERTLSTSDSED